MSDTDLHLALYREKRDAARDELEKERFSVVADMTVKAVEQAVEAVASREGVHFHKEPRTAHRKRATWLKERFPELGSKMDLLWGLYGTLGYGGSDGERARQAVEAMEEILGALEARHEEVFG